MLGQSLGMEDHLLQHLQHLQPLTSAASPQITADASLTQDDETLSTHLQLGIPGTINGIMSHVDDLMPLAGQSALQEHLEMTPGFREACLEEELPVNDDMDEYLIDFPQEGDGWQFKEPPPKPGFQFPDTQPGSFGDTSQCSQASFLDPLPLGVQPACTEPSSPFLPPPASRSPSSFTQLRSESMQTRLDGVSSYPTAATNQTNLRPQPPSTIVSTNQGQQGDQPKPRRERLHGLSDDFEVGIDDMLDTEEMDVFDEVKMTSEMGRDLDPRLMKAYRQCRGTKSLQPILKEELRLKILSRRLGNGQEDLDVVFKEPPQYELTEEERQKKAIRRAQNRGAAQRFRQRKKTREKELKERIEETAKKNAELQQEVETLRGEISRLRGLLDLHLACGDCRLQQDGRFSCWPEITPSLCQTILDAGEVDGRFAISP